jgi:hypothetical protein
MVLSRRTSRGPGQRPPTASATSYCVLRCLAAGLTNVAFPDDFTRDEPEQILTDPGRAAAPPRL